MSKLFWVNHKDVMKALLMTMIGGAVAPLWGALSNPGFNLFGADFVSLWRMALTGSVTGGLGYLVKNFLTDSDGKFIGKVG